MTAKRRGPLVVGAGLVVLAVIVIIGLASGAGKSTNAPNAAGQISLAAPVSLPAVVQPDPAPPAAPLGPLATIPPGTYVVGTGPGDVAPGRYATAGPESGGLGACYWAREKDTSGSGDAIITNGVPTGPTVVTVAATDGAFETSGCAPWIAR